MKKIKIFLASSYELKNDRERFELEINRKNKLWLDKKYFFHLEIWEDLSARMSSSRLQDEYNKKIKNSDLFVLLAYRKVGMYTEEEFETAFGKFHETQKPFIFTYFKDVPSKEIEDSLKFFKRKLKDLGHFYSPYANQDDLWNQFSKELDRLYFESFEKSTIKTKDNSITDNTNAKIKNQFNNGAFKNTTFN
nr:hypothetical protein [uncultured Allomuricauda sp.]